MKSRRHKKAIAMGLKSVASVLEPFACRQRRRGSSVGGAVCRRNMVNLTKGCLSRLHGICCVLCAHHGRAAKYQQEKPQESVHVLDSTPETYGEQISRFRCDVRYFMKFNTWILEDSVISNLPRVLSTRSN